MANYHNNHKYFYNNNYIQYLQNIVCAVHNDNNNYFGVQKQ